MNASGKMIGVGGAFHRRGKERRMYVAGRVFGAGEGLVRGLANSRCGVRFAMEMDRP